MAASECALDERATGKDPPPRLRADTGSFAGKGGCRRASGPELLALRRWSVNLDSLLAVSNITATLARRIVYP
jgi:hypothetical protein